LCGGFQNDGAFSTALQPALKAGLATDSDVDRLSYLAAHVLSLDNDGLPLHEDSVWGRIFLQQSDQIECVKVAAAAFGAAYEAALDDGILRSPRAAWISYGTALAKLQTDMENESAGPDSLALASMLLACAEILSQHEWSSFRHFLGAVEILTKSQEGRQQRETSDALQTIKGELVRTDILVGSYAMSATPVPMHLDFQGADLGLEASSKADQAINSALLCLHRSYQFIDSAAQLRYRHPSWEEHDAVMRKGRSDALDECHAILDSLTALVPSLQAQQSSTAATRHDAEALADVYAMRAQTTATTIYLLCIHTPYQTAYDAHLGLFRNIVSDAAASARLRSKSRANAFKRFSLRPGIVTPLFIVAEKCRDPPLRALAAAMLRDQGREGPTDGRIMAAVAVRLAALETAESIPSSPGAALVASDVLEEQRLHGYGLSPVRVSPIRANGKGGRVVDVTFSRLKVPLPQGWGRVKYDGMDNWTLWTEPIEI
jgi:hypothetical protein